MSFKKAEEDFRYKWPSDRQISVILGSALKISNTRKINEVNNLILRVINSYTKSVWIECKNI